MENKEKVIYILLTDTGTLLNRIIKWFTDAPYNHVSLAFDDKLEEVYSFGRKQPRNPLIAGFVKEDVYTGTYRYFQNTRCLLLKINVTEDEFYNIREIIRYFDSNKDRYSYNLIGLLGVLFHHPVGRKNAYFCSQFVAEVFQRSGLDLWNLPPGLVTPNDFFMHHSFEIIYEGKLYEYPLLLTEMLINVPKRRLTNTRPVAALKKLLPL
ncbi:hypothetical protein [Bacillus kwashiorkori]|uniref:hypothetical protein n=1 Tax=Bacillus kwashiorkori TaxID=1522318 RepID=UPI000785CA36|nr:hypothetical protein [Bacillus kwashiorkori]